MNTAPSISVLIPVYNAERTLRQAIWSVLNQSLEDFEIIIYLDGSVDNSKNIANSFTDPRIIIFENNENSGIVFARNFLVSKAGGKYIAWLDADDYMLPGRLAAQFNFLEVHPDIFMAGSAVEIRNDKRVKKVKWPSDPELIKAWLFFRNPLVQSSLMFRNFKTNPHYEADFEYLEDYRFYSQIFITHKIAILPDHLCSYFQDAQPALIHKYRKYHFVEKLEKIMLHNFSLLDMKPGGNELSLVREFLRSNHRVKAVDAKLIRDFLATALEKNRQKNIFDTQVFKRIIFYQYIRLLKNAGITGSGVLLQLLLHPFAVLKALGSGPKYK